MIVGDGLIANAFKPRFEHDNTVTIFASGVSNSAETREDAFRRERLLLLDAIERCEGTFVYFSTCSLTDPDRQLTPYVKHKTEAERLLATLEGAFVFRLPQVVGRTGNPHTLTNFLASKIRTGERFTIWSRAVRTLIDVDDVAALGTFLIERAEPPSTIDLCTPESLTMFELVEIMERVLGRKGNYETVDRGGGSQPDATLVSVAAAECGIDLSKGYTERVLRKYYGEMK